MELSWRHWDRSRILEDKLRSYQSQYDSRTCRWSKEQEHRCPRDICSPLDKSSWHQQQDSQCQMDSSSPPSRDESPTPCPCEGSSSPSRIPGIPPLSSIRPTMSCGQQDIASAIHYQRDSSGPEDRYHSSCRWTHERKSRLRSSPCRTMETSCCGMESPQSCRPDRSIQQHTVLSEPSNPSTHNSYQQCMECSHSLSPIP